MEMIEIVKKHIVGSVLAYETALAELINSKSKIKVSCEFEKNLLKKISRLADDLGEKLEKLEEAIKGVKHTKDPEKIGEMGKYYREVVFESMENLRVVVDELETLVDAEYWPLPTYSEILFSVL